MHALIYALEITPKIVTQHMLLLESCLQTCMTYTIAECTLNELLMMGR
jgi:hypothetical protein